MVFSACDHHRATVTIDEKRCEACFDSKFAATVIATQQVAVDL
jgi:hypothetical protein